MDSTTHANPKQPQTDPNPPNMHESQPKIESGRSEGKGGLNLQSVKLEHRSGKKMIDQTWNAGKQHVLGSLDNISWTARKVSDELRHTGNAGLAQYAEVWADKTDRLYEYFQNSEVGTLIRDGEQYAKKNPEIFLAGAFILGFIGARFLKSRPESKSQAII
jgi:hypothetical protein